MDRGGEYIQKPFSLHQESNQLHDNLNLLYSSDKLRPIRVFWRSTHFTIYRFTIMILPLLTIAMHASNEDTALDNRDFSGDFEKIEELSSLWSVVPVTPLVLPCNPPPPGRFHHRSR